jgi:hypothetical protein
MPENFNLEMSSVEFDDPVIDLETAAAASSIVLVIAAKVSPGICRHSAHLLHLEPVPVATFASS